MSKHDPTLQKILRGDLIALSRLSYGSQRDLILEALQDTLPQHTQRDPRDSGIALVEALSATVDIFGFYHDRILTESKVGSAQLLSSVIRLAEAVGYAPRPPLAAAVFQFFKARAVGVVPSGSKLAARPVEGSSKIIFETARSLTIGPAFNQMSLEPIIARHIGAQRAVLSRPAEDRFPKVTPLDDFQASAWTMVNGHAGLELSPVDRVRRRAISLDRALRRSYDTTYTRVHCASEWRLLRAAHTLTEGEPPVGREDIVVFEVTSTPILHFPELGASPRLISSLELFIFDEESDPEDPEQWTDAHRWTEVPDFTASEAADLHYRTFVDDRLHTYVALRRKLGYRLLLDEDALARVYVRFIPAVGALEVPSEKALAPLKEPADLSAHTLELSEEYYETPLIRPKVNDQLIRTNDSHWVVLERDPRLLGGRQIVIENSETEELYVRTLSARTIGRYLSWRQLRLAPDPGIAMPEIEADALWKMFADRLGELTDILDRSKVGVVLQSFGHYFPLDSDYPVLPGRGVERNINEGLLFCSDIPHATIPVRSWSDPKPLFVSSLREAIGEGPYHLWDQFYRQFENLSWKLYPSITAGAEQDEGNDDEDQGEDDNQKKKHDDDVELAPEGDLQVKHLEDALWLPGHVDVNTLQFTTIVPRGSTFILVQDTSLVRPGDYFLLGKRVRRSPANAKKDQEKPEENNDALADVVLGDEVLPRNMILPPGPDGEVNPDPPKFEQADFSPDWITAEVLQAVEVQGKIVRLKWPTQNEYTVDFVTPGEAGGKVGEPVTELIVVPQVASVYFGDHFTQKISISPNYALLDSAYAEEGIPESLFVAPVDPPLAAKKLRKSAGWADLDGFLGPDKEEKVKGAVGEAWDDMYLAHSAYASDVTVLPGQGQDNDDDSGHLHWRIVLGLQSHTISPEGLDNAFNQNWIEVWFADDKDSLGTKVDTELFHRDNTNELLVDLSGSKLDDAPIGEPDKYTFRLVIKEPNAEDAGCLWKGADVDTSNKLDFKLRREDHKYGSVVAGALVKVVAESSEEGQEDLELLVRVTAFENVAKFRHIGIEYDPDLVDPVYAKGWKDPKEVWLVGIPVKGGVEAHLLLSSSTADNPLLVPRAPFDDDPATALSENGIVPRATVLKDRFFLESRAAYIPSEKGDFDAIVDGLDNDLVPDVLQKWKSLPNVRNLLDEARLYEAEDELVMGYNLLRADEINGLIVKDSMKPGVVGIFSKSAGPSSMRVTTISEVIEFAGTILTESIVFNSANFIPIRLGSVSHDHKIVSHSLEIELNTVGFADFGEQPLEYAPGLDDLFEFLDKALSGKVDLLHPEYKWGFNKTPDGTFTINFLFVGWFPKDPTMGEVSIKVFYTAAPYQGGTEKDQSLHTATYMICEDELVDWEEDRFYEFETRPLPWNPLRQLVIMNAGDLKSGDYLFVNPSGQDEYENERLICGRAGMPGVDMKVITDDPQGELVEFEEASDRRDYIQWTRIVEVDGRMVMVDPPLKIQPRGFFHYRVTGYRRPPGAQNPYGDYYAGLQPSARPESETQELLASAHKNGALLRFDDRIVLRPWTIPTSYQESEDVGDNHKEPEDVPDGGVDAANRNMMEAEENDKEDYEDYEDGKGKASLPLLREWHLRHLAPGDRLLLWHEAWRNAWFLHRRGLSAEKPWYEWPDYQHEVVIKEIDHELGLIEFERPAPERFGVRYAGPIPDVKEHTVLPFYREPFQGSRVLTSVGDGDRRVKFARYHGRIDLTFGLGSIALPVGGTLASNVEVFTVDARTDEWLRWTEFCSLEGARRKDRAFVLGLEIQGVLGVPECDKYIDKPAPAPAPENCCCADDGADGADGDKLAERPEAESGNQEVPTTTAFTVSFGDGVTGQIPPSGEGNVLVRMVDVGRWCSHFPQDRPRLMTQVRRACLPFRIEPHLAAPENLVLTAEHGAHHQWRPRGGVKGWEPSLVVAIAVASLDPSDFKDPEAIEAIVKALDPAKLLDGVLYLREVSDLDAAEGVDGLIVRYLRPGVVDIFVAHKLDLTPLIAGELPEYVRVYEEARAPMWRLDADFYEEALSHDLTQSEGSRRILLADTEGLAEGSLLGFNRSTSEGEEAEVATVESVSHATFSTWLEEGLTRTYDLERSSLFGNTVEAVQGDSDRQVLGSGDGVTPSLRLPLPRRRPILYSTIGGARGELTAGVAVLVDEDPWELVDTFDGRGPRDRIFMLETEANGDAWIRFGDGRQGAIPCDGIDNIVGVTRSGDGGQGNVALGSLNRLLDGNLAVDKTRNVTPATGGRAADDVDDVREHLMTRDFTHGRVVTADDLGKALLSLTEAVQVRIDPLAGEDRICVYVALSGRRMASPLMLEELVARVSAVMPAGAGVDVEILNAAHVSVHVGVEISVTAGHTESDVIQSVERSFSAGEGGFFDLKRWAIGETLHVGEIYERLFQVPGIATARVRWLSNVVEPRDLPESTPDSISPGYFGVVRCDSDRATDHARSRGNFHVWVKRGGR